MSVSRFFVLEGLDGVGKSTQIDALAQWLMELGHPVVTCRDPGTTATGEAIRDLLLHATSPIDRQAEMLLYMAARAQLVAEVVRPALDASKSVVCDRFLLSNVVYQGYAGGLDVGSIWQVGRLATRGVMPDLSIVLDLPPAVARDRRGPDRDRMERQGAEFQEAVRRGFVELAAQEAPFPIAVIDAAAPPDVVHARVRQAVTPYLGQAVPGQGVTR